MISGSELRDARVRADLTQEQLAQRLGMTHRSIGDWERSKGVPRNREAKVRDVLGHHLTGHPDPGDPLGSVSDVALLAELARRLARRGGTDGATTEAGKKIGDVATGRQVVEKGSVPRS